MNSKILTKFVLYFFILLIVLLIIWFIFNNYGDNLKRVFSIKNSIQAGLISVPQNLNLKPSRDWSIEDLKIAANAAICAETSQSEKDKVLFKKNEDEQLPIASLTKLMTALVVLEKYNLDEKIIISNEAVAQEGGQGLLTAGEMLSVKNLLYIMLIESSNDAAYALAELKGVDTFVDLMNFETMKLGLSGSRFVDVGGLSPDNYSTAEDLVKLTKYLLENYPLIWEIVSLQNFKLYTPEGIFHHELVNTNELLGKIPDIVGGKTGKTAEAKGCLLLVLKNHGNSSNLVYIVLGSDDRFGEMQQLINWVNNAYKW